MFLVSKKIDFSNVVKNIRLVGEVEDALKKLSNEEFEQKYGREKPNSDTEIVFSCQKGRRSQTAMETAKQLGFKKYKQIFEVITIFFKFFKTLQFSKLHWRLGRMDRKT